MSNDRQTPVENAESRFSQGADFALPTYDSIETIVNKSSQTASDPMLTESKQIPLAAIPLNGHSRKILLSILAEIEALPVLEPDLKQGITQELKNIRDKGIPYKWFTQNGVSSSETERQKYSRATLRLERFGILRRITEGHRNRVTHVQVTDRGLRLALRLAGRDANRLAIADGLRLTNWGRELAAAVQVERRRKKPDVQNQQCE